MERKMFNREREKICMLNKKLQRRNIILLLLFIIAIPFILFTLKTKIRENKTVNLITENEKFDLHNERWDELCCTEQTIYSVQNI